MRLPATCCDCIVALLKNRPIGDHNRFPFAIVLGAFGKLTSGEKLTTRLFSVFHIPFQIIAYTERNNAEIDENGMDISLLLSNFVKMIEPESNLWGTRNFESIW